MSLPIAIRLAAEESSVPEARRIVSSAMISADARGELVDDLVLVTSELMSNAVQYGVGDDVELLVADVAGMIEVTVTSAGPAQVGPPRSWSMPSPGSVGGRGLALVRRLSEHVQASSRAGRFVVTAWLRH